MAARKKPLFKAKDPGPEPELDGTFAAVVRYSNWTAKAMVAGVLSARAGREVQTVLRTTMAAMKAAADDEDFLNAVRKLIRLHELRGRELERYRAKDPSVDLICEFEIDDATYDDLRGHVIQITGGNAKKGDSNG